MFKITTILLLLTAKAFCANQVTNDASWDHVLLFTHAPLEVKIGTFDTGPNPDLAVVVLWNDETNNRLDVIRVPAPYDGTGTSSVALENTSTLFALGDMCTEGNNVVVPYIKDFNVEVARFNGANWSTSTIPGTTTNNFDNTDCASTTDGLFIGTHDLTDGETEFFKSVNGGSTYTFYGRYNSSGPFNGAIREPLASNFSQRYIRTLFQQSNGMVRTCHFNTQNSTPNFNCNDIEQLPPPSGFTFVKESAATYNGAGMTMTYNSNGMANALFVPDANPANHNLIPLETINNNPSQYTFQGASIVSVLDEAGSPINDHIIWGDFYTLDVDVSAPPNIDDNFPLAGVGGPSDGCVVRTTVGDNKSDQAFFVATTVGADGTDLYQRNLRSDPIFLDGFESGNTPRWDFTCP